MPVARSIPGPGTMATAPPGIGIPRPGEGPAAAAAAAAFKNGDDDTAPPPTRPASGDDTMGMLLIVGARRTADAGGA